MENKRYAHMPARDVFATGTSRMPALDWNAIERERSAMRVLVAKLERELVRGNSQ